MTSRQKKGGRIMVGVIRWAISCITLLVVVGGSTFVHAQRMPAARVNQPIQVAQLSSSCRTLADTIRLEVQGFNKTCVSKLSQSQYNLCRFRQLQIKEDKDKYSKDCGR